MTKKSRTTTPCRVAGCETAAERHGLGLCAEHRKAWQAFRAKHPERVEKLQAEQRAG